MYDLKKLFNIRLVILFATQFMAFFFVYNDKPLHGIILMLAFISYQLVEIIMGICEVINKLKN